MRNKYWLILLISALCLSPNFIHAQINQAQHWTLNSFEADFAVRLKGFKVGIVSHSMQCDKPQCQLVSIANPPSWAKRFINESSVETVTLEVADQHLNWISYHKDLTRRYSDRTVNIITDLVHNPEQQRIHYVQKSEQWPANPYAYDMISIVYALQFYAKQNLPLPNLFLQDEEQQQQVSFSVQNQQTRTHLNYKSDLKARFYHWNTADYDVKVWLIEELDLFPGRIELHNKKVDHRVVLSLASAPNFTPLKLNN